VRDRASFYGPFYNMTFECKLVVELNSKLAEYRLLAFLRGCGDRGNSKVVVDNV
jgi:hypothetical protein